MPVACSWRNKEPPKETRAGTWRPPVLPVMYDKPQEKLFSALDRDPIIERVLIKPRMPPPRSFPIFGTPGYQFLAGLWTGAMITFIFTTKPLARKEMQDLVLYDPHYFPEFAKKA
jgi:hypothetical protein